MSVVSNAVGVGQAILMVVNFIEENELYNFQSLAEETQAKLISTYGTAFESAVNGCLLIGEILQQA